MYRLKLILTLSLNKLQKYLVLNKYFFVILNVFLFLSSFFSDLINIL